MPDFRSLRQAAGNVAGFLTRPLIDLPDQYFKWGGPVGGFVEETLEGISSPIGLASMALLPVTGGTSLGLRGALGAGTKLATRGAAELAVGAGANLGARGAGAAAEHVAPDNPYVNIAAQLGGGFLGGGITSAGVGKGLYEATPLPKVREVSPHSVPIDLGGVKKGQGLAKKSGELYTGPAPGIANRNRPDVNRIARGKDALLGRIRLETSVGGLAPERAAIGERFVEALPEKYLKTLASSFKRNPDQSVAGGTVAGYYTPEDSLMTIIKSVDNPTTIPHEVAHHLEPFLDQKDFDRLRKVWRATVEPKHLEYKRITEAMERDLQTLGRSTPEGMLLESTLARMRSETPYSVQGGFNEWFAENLANRDLPDPTNKGVKGLLERAREVYDDVKGALDDAMRGTDTRTPDRVAQSFVDGEYGVNPARPDFQRLTMKPTEQQRFNDGIFDGKPSEGQTPEQAARFEEMRRLRESAAKPERVSESPPQYTEDALRNRLRNKVTEAQASGDEAKIREAMLDLESLDRKTGKLPPTPPQDQQPLAARYTPEATLDMVEAATRGMGFDPQDAEYIESLIQQFLTSKGVDFNEFLKSAEDEDWQRVTEQLLEELRRGQS